MTPEQQAAYIMAQAASAMIEAIGMAAENLQRDRRGEAIAYNEQAFTDLILKYGIYHNATIGFFTGRR